MRGMGKTREDFVTFRKITEENNILVFGKLVINETSIFEKGARDADDELIAMYIRGGYMPVSDGSYENGVKFREFVKRIDRG